MPINEKKLEEMLAKYGLKDEEKANFMKGVLDEEPKQDEMPAEEIKEEPKQEVGETEKPVEDKTEETPKAQEPIEGEVEKGGEPETPKAEEHKGLEEKLNALEAKVNDMVLAIEGRDKKIETYEQLLAKIGLPTDGKDPKQFGGNKSDGSQDNPIKGNVEANIKEINEILGYSN